ncbi:MAG: alanine dehydrogenase, partial [Candidatus Binatia bacterium]
VRSMRSGTAIVDVAIDQGGCVETIRPTSHHDPIFIEEGVVHYGVTNMPGIVPNTATNALTNATLSYAAAIADQGLDSALREDAALQRALNVFDGRVTHPGVAGAFDLPWTAPEEALS